MTRTLTTLAAAATLGIAMFSAPGAANARCFGCGIAAGAIGGFALGSILGSAAAAPYYYPAAPYAYYPAVPYAYYAPRCWWRHERVWDGHRWRVARMRVCR